MKLDYLSAVYYAEVQGDFTKLVDLVDLVDLVESGDPLLLKDEGVKRLIIKKLLGKPTRAAGRPKAGNAPEISKTDDLICWHFAYWVARGRGLWGGKESAHELTAKALNLNCDLGKKSRIRQGLSRAWRVNLSLYDPILKGLVDERMHSFGDELTKEQFEELMNLSEEIFQKITQAVHKHRPKNLGI